MIRITDTIYLVPGKNRGRFPYCHCLYIRDEVNVLIDSAAGAEALAPLLGCVDILVNTHYHPDHIRGNHLFPNARVLCHPADRAPIESREHFLYYTGFHRFSPPELEAVCALVQYRESGVAGTFSDGDVLDFGRTRLRVIHTPGHSPGHCSFYEEKEGILIGADVDLTPFGPWYGHDLSDLEDFEHSLARLKTLGASRFLSSHEEAFITSGVSRRLAEYASVFDRRDRVILDALQTPQTLDALVKRMLIYPRHPEPVPLFQFFERNMLEKHLSRMIRLGKISLRGRVYKSRRTDA